MRLWRDLWGTAEELWKLLDVARSRFGKDLLHYAYADITILDTLDQTLVKYLNTYSLMCETDYNIIRYRKSGTERPS